MTGVGLSQHLAPELAPQDGQAGPLLFSAARNGGGEAGGRSRSAWPRNVRTPTGHDLEVDSARGAPAAARHVERSPQAVGRLIVAISVLT